MEFTFKHTGIAIPDPTQMSQGDWTAPCVVPGHLVTDLLGSDKFLYGYHIQLLTNSRA